MMRKLHTLVIGSGAAGLCAALSLHRRGVTDMAIYTEGLQMGTSINTGSDKQTYYKLGMYSGEADSPAAMARDLSSGGAMHGDLALVESAASAAGFMNLVQLGVPFPHDEYGQYIGYKTDHDPKRRATSCGPYTSREMCRALIREVELRRIECCEKRVAVKLLTCGVTGGKRCCGAVFVDRRGGKAVFETVLASNVVFAVGGPGGLFRDSVYPCVHTGAIGLALEAGARSRNLPEFQYGLASTGFRWNVSGSYMQVLPRFISRAADGSDEREFLREYFDGDGKLCDAVFLKGYQWPFACGNIRGSSLIDILVHIESAERKRKVFLDYRTNPSGLDFDALSPETFDYLKRSGALGATPLERLRQMNEPAVQLYYDHGIDLASEPLEIALSAQHNNGGLAGDLNYESENLKGLFPIGEVNGSHGVTRPGGSALNAGQVGALRCAEYIACSTPAAPDCDGAEEQAVLEALLDRPCRLRWQEERRKLQARMSEAAGAIREKAGVAAALSGARKQLTALENDGLSGLSPFDVSEALRNRQLLTASVAYLEAIFFMLAAGVGSRGGAIELDPAGEEFSRALPAKWRIAVEDRRFRRKVLTGEYRRGGSVMHWEDCREVPETDGWFEEVWKRYRNERGEV